MARSTVQYDGASFDYIGGAIGSFPGAVSSVFARTGAVVAVTGDYYGAVAAALTGATQASRYVGATSSGAPASGTFAVGDFVIARDGHVFVCTTAGSPGTWTDVGSAGAVSSVFGRTGAVVAATNDYTEAQISFSDITTNDSSTSKHGYLKKLDNNSAHFMDGTGAWSTPGGGFTYTDKRSEGASTSGTPGTSVASITASGSNQLISLTVFATQTATANTQFTTTVTFSDSTTVADTSTAGQGETLLANNAGFLRLRAGVFIAQNTYGTKKITQVTVVTAGTGTGSRAATIAALEVA